MSPQIQISHSHTRPLQSREQSLVRRTLRPNLNRGISPISRRTTLWVVANLMIVQRRKIYNGRDAAHVLGYESPLSADPGAQKWRESTRSAADGGVRAIELAPHPVSPASEGQGRLSQCFAPVLRASLPVPNAPPAGRHSSMMLRITDLSPTNSLLYLNPTLNLKPNVSLLKPKNKEAREEEARDKRCVIRIRVQRAKAHIPKEPLDRRAGN
ncbi:hypothetical protein U1Q18_009731 [Sarracenia purpurea var. burkii]